MASAWNQLRNARVQVALESVILKRFNSPLQSMERRIIQSQEFREQVIPAWAKYCLKTSKPLTIGDLHNLRSVRLPSVLSEDCKWVTNKIMTEPSRVSESRPAFPEELSLSGPKYPFAPRDLYNLQRKTDTLTGREYTRRIQVSLAKLSGTKNSDIVASSKQNRRREREQLKEYSWKLEDDDDNLREDILAPRYSSF